MSIRRTLTGAVGLAAAVAALGACAAPASRFRTDAIEFIGSETMFGAYDIDFANVDCTEPPSTDEGETMACRADGDDGERYVLTFTIIGRNSLELSAIAFADAPAASSPAGSSVPESSVPDSSVASDDPANSVTAPTAPAPTTVPAPTTIAPAVTTTSTTSTSPTTTAAPTG